jgi:hypothetical protein
MLGTYHKWGFRFNSDGNCSGCFYFPAGQGVRSAKPEAYFSYVEDLSTATTQSCGKREVT